MERIAAINKGKSKTGILQQKRVLAAAAEIAGGVDPMRGDECAPYPRHLLSFSSLSNRVLFLGADDKDEDLHRRTEAIMTKTFGSVSCRRLAASPHPAHP